MSGGIATVAPHRITSGEPFTLYVAQPAAPTWADLWDACERAYTPNDGSRGCKVRRVAVNETQLAALMREHSGMPTSFSGDDEQGAPLVTDVEGKLRLQCSYGAVGVEYARASEMRP